MSFLQLVLSLDKTKDGFNSIWRICHLDIFTDAHLTNITTGGVPGPGCTWFRGVYLVLGGVPGPGGCTWSRGVYLVPGGVPGPGGCLPGTPPGT